MNWQIEYYNQKLEEQILSLPDGLLARYLRLTDIMLEFGSNLGLPHTKPIGSNLFELRVKSKEGISKGFLLHENWQENYHASLIYKEISKNTPKRA